MDNRTLHDAARAAGRFQALALARLSHGDAVQLDRAGRKLVRLLASLGFTSE